MVMNSSTRSTSPPFFLVGVVLLGLVAGCAEQDQPVAAAPGEEPLAVPLTVLALGDSYTKGESLPAFFSWPRQLADTLAVAGDTLQSLKVLAETGWTTRDLLGAMRAQADQLDSNGYGLVTLMIGVNNQFPASGPGRFRRGHGHAGGRGPASGRGGPRPCPGFLHPRLRSHAGGPALRGRGHCRRSGRLQRHPGPEVRRGGHRHAGT